MHPRPVPPEAQRADLEGAPLDVRMLGGGAHGALEVDGDHAQRPLSRHSPAAFVVLAFVGCNSRELVPLADERPSLNCDPDEAFELVGSSTLQLGDLRNVRTTKRPVGPDRRDECLEMVRPMPSLCSPTQPDASLQGIGDR
jgi:hypothetical protein